MELSEQSGKCWIIAACAAATVLLFVWGIGEASFLAGLFLALITFFLFGSLLVWLTCHDRSELFVDSHGATGTDWERQAVERQPESLLVSGSLVAEPAAGSGPAAQMPIMAGATPAQTSAPAVAKPAPAPAKPAAAAAKAPAQKAPAQTKPAPGPESVKAAPVKAPAQASKAAFDDLKRIKGIGPKLSDWLHENGVTRYEQIAAWDAAAVADFAGRLGRMGGRIEADDWVAQAKLLAAGGETEFSHRVDEGEVY